MRATRYGAAIQRGVTAMFQAPHSWSRSSPCRYCCAIERNWAKLVWALGVGLIAIAAAVQAASVAFWLSLEIYQMTTLGHPTFVVGLRFKNIVAFALGKMDAWGLTNSDMLTDPWDYVKITTWNFLPFVLRRVGEAPRWVVRGAFAFWFAGIGSLAWVLWRLQQVLSAAPESTNVGNAG